MEGEEKEEELYIPRKKLYITYIFVRVKVHKIKQLRITNIFQNSSQTNYYIFLMVEASSL